MFTDESSSSSDSDILGTVMNELIQDMMESTDEEELIERALMDQLDENAFLRAMESASSDDVSVEETSHTSSSDEAGRENDSAPNDDSYNNCDSDEPPPEKRRKKPPPEEDKISTMPDSILLHILSFLHTANVVRTGALSRRWQYLWTSVASLDFTYTGYERYFNPGKFSTFIDRTLILHKCCKVNKFVLDFRYNHSFASLVDVWVRFATRANVEELTLFYYFGYCRTDVADIMIYDHYVLPQHRYTNSSITKLLFCSCIVAPIGLIDWRRLKSLKIGHTNLSEDVLQKIFLGCPVLEFLGLNNFISINRLHVSSASLRKLVIEEYGHPESVSELLEINAPNIQSLEMSGCMFMRKCRLINLGSLVECSMTFELSFGMEEDEDPDGDWDFDYTAQHNVIMEILHDLRNVEKLTLGGYYCIQTLSAMEANGFPSSRSTRKYLILESCIQKYDLPGIASLLESSPNLEKLVIDMSAPPHGCQSELLDITRKKLYVFAAASENCKDCWLQSMGWQIRTRVPSCSISSQECKEAREDGNAQKVSLGESQKAPDPSYLYQVTQKLLSFPRYSQEAVVLFSE